MTMISICQQRSLIPINIRGCMILLLSTLCTDFVVSSTESAHAWLMVRVISAILDNLVRRHSKGRTHTRFIEEGKMGRKLRLEGRNLKGS
jgi:hypothetical protein